MTDPADEAQAYLDGLDPKGEDLLAIAETIARFIQTAAENEVHPLVVVKALVWNLARLLDILPDDVSEPLRASVPEALEVMRLPAGKWWRQ